MTEQDNKDYRNLDIQIEEALKAYLASGVEDQVDYQKFYLYSIVTHSTAIEGSTVTEIENLKLRISFFSMKVLLQKDVH